MRKLPIKMSPGLALSMLDRAVKEHFGQRCTSSDLEAIAAYFERAGNLKCIYCGGPPNRWDHFHPVSRGGDTVPGNLVPACGSCDDSKGKKTLEEWARGQGKHRPKASAIPKIEAEVRAYQAEFTHAPQEFEVKLSSEQLSKYARFRQEIDRLRAHLTEEGILK
jgi:hypothetical protein